jgi:transcriptional regulator with XRE-family HTH domain
MSEAGDREADLGLVSRAAVRDFLISRRARITPETVGLTAAGRRRVLGLRREEVAALAGVSPEWYTRLEKGHIGDVSESVLDAVARALLLSDEEGIYLHDLANAARPRVRKRGGSTSPPLPDAVQWMLDGMTLSAATIVDQRLDIMAANPIAQAIYMHLFDERVGHDDTRPNVALYHFLDPRSRDFDENWDITADDLVSTLRAEAGRDPQNTALRHLIGELSKGSPEFRTRWAAQNVRTYRRGSKSFRHPEVGHLTLAYHSMSVPVSATDNMTMCVYTPEPGSDTEERMRVLASWSATALTDVPSGSPAI